jgi:glycosyltransferase involved in cell wall biosynthesis
MKILQVIQRFPPAVGGGEEVVFQLCKALAKRGHDITVVTSNWLHDNDVPGISSSRINLQCSRCPLTSVETKDGIEIYRFGPWLRLWTYCINPGLAMFLFQHADDYDLIHAHYYMFLESDIAAMASALNHKPFVLTHHRSLALIGSQGTPYRIAKLTYDRTLGKFTINNARRIIVLTESMKREFMQIGVSEEKLKVIPNGVDFQRFNPKVVSESLAHERDSAEKIVLFVGRLERPKGAQYIVEAAPMIIKKFPNTKFIFVGEDWGYGQTLKEMGEKMGIMDKLVFAGRVVEERLIALYKIADVLVFPSIGEGFGMVAVESIACGTPVVLANADGLADILTNIGGYGLNMHQNLANQISEIVIEVFSNSNIKNEIACQRQRLKEKLDWTAIAQKTEEIYQEVV